EARETDREAQDKRRQERDCRLRVAPHQDRTRQDARRQAHATQGEPAQQPRRLGHGVSARGGSAGRGPAGGAGGGGPAPGNATVCTLQDEAVAIQQGTDAGAGCGATVATPGRRRAAAGRARSKRGDVVWTWYDPLRGARQRSTWPLGRGRTEARSAGG